MAANGYASVLCGDDEHCHSADMKILSKSHKEFFLFNVQLMLRYLVPSVIFILFAVTVIRPFSVAREQNLF
jgi:hypothetical protein